MIKNLVDVFTSNEYKLLHFLKSKQLVTHNNRIIDSQEDIAKEYGVSIATLNKLMKNLLFTGCIKKYKQRSGYLITARGAYVIRQIEKINRFKGGEESV